MHQRYYALPQTPVRRLTALPQIPSWWGGGWLPLLKNPNPNPLRPWSLRLRILGRC